MDAFVSRKRRRTSPSSPTGAGTISPSKQTIVDGEGGEEEEEESTDVKLAILSSLNPSRSQDDLLEVLLSCDGSVEKAVEVVSTTTASSPSSKRPSVTGMQSALPFTSKSPIKTTQPLTKKGRTLHLYTPEDIAAHTPCSIIHTFLPPDLANALLNELLPEAATYTSATFKIFDNIVSSPHTACFYVTDQAALHRQKHEYHYNGSSVTDIREILPLMRQVSSLVEPAVNSEIASRIESHYPDGKKLQYQSPQKWIPNAAFVNCYDGPHQSVGYHSDQLSYLGPRAVIGSLSLGVAREFRVRRIVPPDSRPSPPFPTKTSTGPRQADTQGQISIHLPHNSLLVMHAEMQEEWKHAIAPAQSITPHPIAGNKRINITYRWYRDDFHPKHTPKCRCGVPTVLKCVQKRKETRGRYMWMCQVANKTDLPAVPAKDIESRKGDKHGGGSGGGGSGDGAPTGSNTARNPGGKGCGYFEWAEFTDDGDPIWKHRKHTQPEQ